MLLLLRCAAQRRCPHRAEACQPHGLHLTRSCFFDTRPAAAAGQRGSEDDQLRERSFWSGITNSPPL